MYCQKRIFFKQDQQILIVFIAAGLELDGFGKTVLVEDMHTRKRTMLEKVSPNKVWLVHQTP